MSKVEYGGKIYNSISHFASEVAEELGIDEYTLLRRIYNKKSIKNAVNYKRKKRVNTKKFISFNYNGVEYSSISEFCNKNRIVYQTFLAYRRKHKDEDIITIVDGFLNARLIILGKEFEKVVDVCRHHRINYKLAKSKIKESPDKSVSKILEDLI